MAVVGEKYLEVPWRRSKPITILEGLSLRNACSHNNCILNNMIGCPTRHNAQPAVTQGLEAIGFSVSQRRSKMRNEVFQQIATTLYAHQRWSSKGVKANRGASLRKFCLRMLKHWDYYKDNGQVASGFFFIAKAVRGWYPCEIDAEFDNKNGECDKDDR